MTRRKKEAQLGRPNEGLGEARIELRVPDVLATAMKRMARDEDLPISEVWRRAARAYLGLENRLPESEDES